MDDSHMPGMHGIEPPSSMDMDNNTGMDMHPHKMMMMMHMTFFWGSNAEILFSGWPGTRTGMYVLSLIFIFVLSLLVEWLSHCNFIKSDSTNNVAVGFLQTAIHGLRMALAYLAMLAVMSFNVGVFLVAVAGHSVGFLLFGSRVFKKQQNPTSGKTSDLPPMSC